MSGKKRRTKGSFSFLAASSPVTPPPIPDIPLPVELDPEFSDDPNRKRSRTADEDEELDAENVRDVQADRNGTAVALPNGLHLSTDTGAARERDDDEGQAPQKRGRFRPNGVVQSGDSLFGIANATDTDSLAAPSTRGWQKTGQTMNGSLAFAQPPPTNPFSIGEEGLPSGSAAHLGALLSAPNSFGTQATEASTLGGPAQTKPQSPPSVTGGLTAAPMKNSGLQQGSGTAFGQPASSASTFSSGTTNASTSSRPFLRGPSSTSKLFDAPRTTQHFSSSPNSLTQSSVGTTSEVDVFGQPKGSGAALGQSALSSSPFGYGGASQSASSGTSSGAPLSTLSLFGAPFSSHIGTPQSARMVNSAAPAPSQNIFGASNPTKWDYLTPALSTIPGTTPPWGTNGHAGYTWGAPSGGVSYPGGLTGTSIQAALPQRVEASITTDPFGESSFFERVSLMLKQELADATVFEMDTSSSPLSPTPSRLIRGALTSCAVERRFHDDYSAASYALGASLFRKPQIALHPSSQTLATEPSRPPSASRSVLQTTVQAARIRNIKRLVIND